MVAGPQEFSGWPSTHAAITLCSQDLLRFFTPLPDGFSSRSSLCSRSPISHPVSGPLTGVISSTSRLVLLRTRWALVHCPMDTPDSSFREIIFTRRLSMSLHPMMSAVPCLLLDVPRRTADTVGCSVAGYTHVLLANEDDCPSTTDFYVNEG